MSENDVESLKNQLSIARNEINKLRLQVKNLTYVQRKDVEHLQKLLKDFSCEGCKQNEENERNSNDAKAVDSGQKYLSSSSFRPIGIIRTAFPEKRAVPRQPSVGATLQGTIELNSDCFTNPEHSLQGLEEFSHMWIIYHFHRNMSHPKAKVAPPRLGGERVGVFSTRSPHRPCPIGLSLVEIVKIEDAKIYFNGTDMVDETPVLDIKPYIPFYDSPSLGATALSASTDQLADFYNSRQEPDGEESDLEPVNGASSIVQSNRSNKLSPHAGVKIPNWIAANHPLAVLFNERAISQIAELQIDKRGIIDILETDPRSVYLRTKHGSQIFTFQLNEVTVTCKFDDKMSSVTVVQIRKTDTLKETN